LRFDIEIEKSCSLAVEMINPWRGRPTCHTAPVELAVAEVIHQDKDDVWLTDLGGPAPCRRDHPGQRNGRRDKCRRSIEKHVATVKSGFAVGIHLCLSVLLAGS
jgi:hypothetical protein